MEQFAQFSSPVGTLTARCEDGFLTGLWFGAPDIPGTIENDTTVFLELRRWLTQYFAGQPMECTVPMKLCGTAFQQSVWELLSQIPYGQTVTYGTLAKQLGPRMSAQAVGQAVGKNPIAILIPCHRVLGTNGKITGYAGGLDKKRFLLDLEGIPYR